MTRPLASYDGNDPYVFVSYSHADENVAYPEIRWLQDHGFNVWWDEGISPGAAWRTELAEALHGCSAIIYLVTPNSVQSSHCIREINFGLDQYHRPVVAVHLQETELPDALGLSLSDRQAILKYNLSPEDYARKLGTLVAGLLAQPVPAVTLHPKAPGAASRTSWLRNAVGVVMAMVLAVAATWVAMSSRGPLPLPVDARFRVALPPGVQLPMGPEYYFNITPDGEALYFIGQSRNGERELYVRRMQGLDVEVISGAAAQPGEELQGVFPSPNGAELLLFYGRADGGVIKRIQSAGGEATTVALTEESAYLRLHWGAADRIYYRNAGVIWETNREFSNPEMVVEPNEAYNRVAYPFYDPARNLLYYVRADIEGAMRSRPSVIETLSLDSGETSFLTEGGHPTLSGNGLLVFRRDESLWAARLTGDGSTIARETMVLQGDFFEARTFAKGYALADQGTLVYEPGPGGVGQRLMWADRDGVTRVVGMPVQPLLGAQVSPGMDIIAYTAGAKGTDLWVYSTRDGLESRLTVNNAPAFAPRWAADNQSLAYTSYVTGTSSINRTDLKTRVDQPLFANENSTGVAYVSDWTPDQQGILVTECTGIFTGCDVGMIRLSEPNRVTPLLATGFNTRNAMLSPGGDFLAYLTDEFGVDRIVIRPFPETADAFWQVAADDCGAFEWIGTGEIIAECQQALYSIPIATTETTVEPGPPRRLFDLNNRTTFSDALDDGQGFLLLTDEGQGLSEFIVDLNWITRVAERLAVLNEN